MKQWEDFKEGIWKKEVNVTLFKRIMRVMI